MHQLPERLVLREEPHDDRIVLHGGLREWFEARGLTAHVSVTDETDYAASFVVVEKKAQE
jgi:holo-[acyl-carrier protein] synthase